MNPDALEKNTQGQDSNSNDTPSSSGVLKDAQALWHELRGLILARFQLAILETQQAGNSLIIMIIAGVIIAILLGSAWLGLMAAVALWLIENGVVMASSAILLAVTLNLLLAIILCGVIRDKSRNMQFPSTLRALQPISPELQNTEK
ncbi:phage holin family protein [Methylobacter psychrophilus]|uniref:phage holin family protein n=1 Tax=Methylobacter psychrophilus TaxID=96941 RepID=UPI0021D49BDA|nr:phage holin family protein [Methylobacter psychrophilus]